MWRGKEVQIESVHPYTLHYTTLHHTTPHHTTPHHTTPHHTTHYTCTHTQTCTCIYTHTHICTHTHTCTYTRIYIYRYIYRYRYKKQICTVWAEFDLRGVEFSIWWWLPFIHLYYCLMLLPLIYKWWNGCSNRKQNKSKQANKEVGKSRKKTLTLPLQLTGCNSRNSFWGLK